MNKTKIEWCDSTWNPVTGCYHDCPYCYARRMVARFGRKYGKSADENAHDVLELTDPIKGENGKYLPYPTGFVPTLHRYRLHEYRRKTGRTIFVCSMADLFGDWVPDEWIEDVFAACKAAPQHRYLFLTKNPQRLCDLANQKILPYEENFWYGCTLDNKSARRYPRRIRDNTFLSIEPLTEYMNAGLGSFGGAKWIIIGAETGNRKEKVVPQKEWIDNICEAANLTQAAVFMKDSLIPVMGEENMRREFPWANEGKKK